MLETLNILRLHFELLSAGMRLAKVKSSAFHGGFGLALKQVSPTSYAELFSAKGDAAEAHVPPFALVPPLTEATDIPAGARLGVDLHLFGAATDHALACIAAIERLGAMGVDKERGRYTIERIVAIEPAGAPVLMTAEDGLLAVPQPTTAGAIMATWAGRQASAVTVALETPLRLKAENRLLQEAPSFPVLFARILGRLALLARQNLVSEERKALLEAAYGIGIEHADVRWVDWPRYSSRQKTDMRFGGLLGYVRYQGELTPFLPWLGLAEQLLVGGKTTFGLGKVSVAIR